MLRVKLGSLLRTTAPSVFEALIRLGESLRSLPEFAEKYASKAVQFISEGRLPKVEGNIVDVLKVRPESRPWVVIPSTETGVPAGQIFDAIERSGIRLGKEPLAKTINQAVRNILQEGTEKPPVITIPEAKVILAPTKREPGATADVDLIKNSLKAIVQESEKRQEPVILPLLGSGSGRISRDTSEKLISQVLDEVGADTRRFVVLAPEQTPEVRKATAETLSLLEKEAKIKQIAAAPKVEKPLTTGTDLPHEILMVTKPVVGEAARPVLVVKEPENAKRLVDILKNAGFEVRTTKIQGTQAYAVALDINETIRTQKLQKIAQQLLEEEQKDAVPNIPKVAKIAARLLSTYGSTKYGDPITEDHIRTVIDVATKLSKYIPDELFEAVQSGAPVDKKEIIGALKRALANELASDTTVARAAQPLTFGEVLSKTKAILVPYAYRWLYDWDHSGRTAISILHNSVSDILRLAGYSLKEEPGDVFRLVKVASTDELASLAQKIKPQLPRPPKKEIITNNIREVPRLVAEEAAIRIAQIDPKTASPRISIPVKVQHRDRWYGMVFRINNLPRSVLGTEKYDDLVKYLEGVIREEQQLTSFHEMFRQSAPDVPTSLVDVAVWRLRRPTDVIPEIGMKIKPEDIPEKDLPEWMEKVTETFSMKRDEIESSLHDKVSLYLSDVAEEIERLNLPESHVARSILRELKSRDRETVKKIVNTAKVYISEILNHMENKPSGVLLPPRFRPAEGIEEIKNIKAMQNQFAKRLAIRTILEEISRAMPTRMPAHESRAVLQSLYEYLGRKDIEKAGSVIIQRMASPQTYEISQGANINAIDAMRALLNVTLSREVAPKWDEVQMDRIMATLKDYVYGTPGLTTRVMQLLKDPAWHIGDIAKMLRDEYVLKEAVPGHKLSEQLKVFLRQVSDVTRSAKSDEEKLRAAYKYFEGFIEQLKSQIKNPDELTNTIARVTSAAYELSTKSKLLEDKMLSAEFARAVHTTLADYIINNPSIMQRVKAIMKEGLAAQKEIAEAVAEVEKVMKGGFTAQSVVWPFPPSILKILRIPEPDTKAALYEFYKRTGAPTLTPIVDYVQPTLFVFAKDPKLLQLYHLRRQIDIAKARFINDWVDRWKELWMNTTSTSKRRIIDAIEGKLDIQLLTPDELLKLKQYRSFMAKLAEQTRDSQGNPIKHTVGSQVTLAPEGWKRKVTWEIIAENLDHPSNRPNNPEAWTYTIKAQVKLPNGRVQEITRTVPIEQIDPKFRPDYFPHRFRGNWVVYYPNAHIESTKLAVFDTIEEAVEYIINNTSWDANGRPFREILEEMVRQKQATDVVEAAIKLGVKVEPRFMIPDPFTVGLTPKQIGKLSQQILQELKERGLVTDNGELAAGEVYRIIRQAGVQQRAGFAPRRPVRATMPRTAELSTYLADPDEGFRIHIYQLASQMYSNEWRRSADVILKDFYNNVVVPNINNRRTVQLWEFVNAWARDVDSYTPGRVEEWLNELFETLKLGSATNFLREAAQWFSAIKLGNIISPIINLTQTIITTYPVLGAKYTTRGIEAFLKYLATRDPQLEKILIDAGASTYSPVFTIQPFLPTKIRNVNLPNTLRGFLLMPFSGAEWFNRGVAALGAYYKALDNGVKDPITFVRAVVDRTQGEYSKTGTAAVLRGTLPAFVFQFRKFFSLYISFMGSLFREMPVEAGRLDPKGSELARFLVASTMLGGVLSLPMVGIVDREIRRKYGISPLDIVRETRPEIYDVLSRGLPVLMGIDISGRMGIGRDIEQLTEMVIRDQPVSYLAELSPWASTVYDLVSAAIDVVKYQDDRSVDKFLATTIPLGLWYMYIAAKQRTARAFDPNKLAFEAPSSYMTVPGVYSVRTGRLLMKEPDDDPMFWAKKMLGLRTYRESLVAAAVERMLDQAHRYSVIKDQYERKILSAARRNDWDEVNRLREEALQKYGIPIEYDRVTAMEALQELDQLNRYYRRLAKEIRGEAIESVSKMIGEEWQPLPTRRRPATVPLVPSPTVSLPSIRF